MNKSESTFLFFITLAYALLWWLLAPSLGYLLDSDGVAYLTIARRVAEGDFQKSINGLWSPLNSWLLVPFIKLGFNAWEVAKVFNFCVGLCILVLVNKLNQLFIEDGRMRKLMLLPLPIVMIYFSYFQMFGDLLQLIFIIAYLCVLYSKSFQFQTSYLVFAGVLIGIGFYAKAYAFIFLVIHSGIFYGIHFWNLTIDKRQLIRALSITIGTTLLIMAPWIFILHQKYQVWSLTGLAGKLNMSWYILSHKTFRPDIHLLIPPTYNDSPSFWEDPYGSQGKLSSPLTSFYCFGRWLLRVGHTILMAVKCYSQLTLLSIPFLMWVISRFYKLRFSLKKWLPELQLLLTILIFPVGYLTMHIETRYIWLSAFLLLILMFRYVTHYKTILNFTKRSGVMLVILCSFTLFPIYDLWNLRYKNQDLFIMADQLKQRNVKGKFASDIDEEGQMWVVAYLSNSVNYTIEQDQFAVEELMPELKRYEIDFFIADKSTTVDYNENKDFRTWFPNVQQLSGGQLLYSR